MLLSWKEHDPRIPDQTEAARVVSVHTSHATRKEVDLAAIPLFAHLKGEQCASMAAAGAIVSLEPDQIAFREGDPSTSLYVILDGQVKIVKQDDRLGEVELRSAGVGEYFGEFALIDGEARSATIITLTPCEFFVLERTTFLDLLLRSPESLSSVLTNLTRSLRATSDRVLKEALEQQTVRMEMEVARYRSLAEMVAGVAHEINTPLGIVNTAASVVKSRVSSETLTSLAADDETRSTLDDVREATELMESNIQRAHRLIQDFKKLSVGQLSDQKETLDLVAVVEEVVGLFALSARQAKLEIEVHHDLADAAARQWLGYRGYMTQVLLNLLANIERYAYLDGSGGNVDLSIRAQHQRKEDTFVIAVRDFGQGIPPEIVERVFDPFVTTGRSKGGTGLGLAIVRNIVTSALKGSIDLESMVGRGTTVTIRIPKAVAD
jgi:signal transduction histidine kinase